MSLRLRFALWYAGLTSAVIVIMALSVYAVHGRSLYADIDRTLVDDTALVAPLLALLQDAPEPVQPPPLQAGSSFVRAYDERGGLLALETGAAGPPPISVDETLDADAGPAHDPLIGLVFRSNIAASGGFATVRRTEDGPRIRVYAVEVTRGDKVIGYVQSWTSLRNVDLSMRRFRWMLLGLGALGVVLAAGGSAALTGRALRPLASVTATAAEIATRRDFTRRVPRPRSSDELGELAGTLNAMLDALGEAYRSQQRFVADAAHELRAPLTAIRGNIDLLAAHHEMSDDDRVEAIHDLQAETRWLSRLVEELLVLARSDAGQPIPLRPTTLDAAVLDTVREVDPARRGRVVVHTEASIPILGDRDRLRQMAFILIDNALRYSGDEPVHVGVAVAGETATLVVSDRGIGIAADDLPRVWERFYRGDPARSRAPGGAGLGLPIAKWIAEAHHGRIAIDSRVGSGTTVSVMLPLRSSEPPPANAPVEIPVD